MQQKSFTFLFSLFVFIGVFNLANAQNVHQSNANVYLINPVYLDADSGAFIHVGNYHLFTDDNAFGSPSQNTSSLAAGAYIPRLKSTLSLYHSKQKDDDYWYTNWEDKVSTTAIVYNTALIQAKELTLNMAVSGVYTSSNYPYFNETPDYYPYFDCIITPGHHILNHNGVKHADKFRTDIGIRARWKRFDFALGVNSLLGTDEKIQTYLDAPTVVKKNELYTNLQASYIIKFSKQENGFSIQPKVSIINQQKFNDWQATLQANLKGQSLGYVMNDRYLGAFVGSSIKQVSIAAQVTWSNISYGDFGRQPYISASLQYNFPSFLSNK